VSNRFKGGLSTAALCAGAAVVASAALHAQTPARPNKPAPASATAAAASVPMVPTGKAKIDEPVKDFALLNVATDKPAPLKLSDYKGKKNVVLVWLSYTCPVTQQYEERMGKLVQQYGTKNSDVAFVAVHANLEQTNERIKRYAQDKNFTGAVLDDKQKLPGITEYFQAKATPTVVIIDKAGVMRFKGRIDNNPGDLRGEEPGTKKLVVAALTAIKDGKEIAIKTSPTPG